MKTKMNKPFLFLVCLMLLNISLKAQTYTVSVFAGSENDESGDDDGIGINASFALPTGLCIDKDGNLYVADTQNQKIRKVTPSGLVSTIAGSGDIDEIDGLGTAAVFTYPSDITIDKSGNLYVVGFYKVRKISTQGYVNSYAGTYSLGSKDGDRSIATFYFPSGITVDEADNLYLADVGNNKIRKISKVGVVSTIAGSGTQGSQDGPGADASFNKPSNLAVSKSGDIYVTDRSNHKIRKITPDGIVSTFAGTGKSGFKDGLANAATFYNPKCIVVDTFGNVFVADDGNHRIRKITPQGLVSTIAGGGIGESQTVYLRYPEDLVIDANGVIYVIDNKSQILKITPDNISTNIKDEQLLFDLVSIFPNPATEKVTVVLPVGSFNLSLFDSMGRLVVSESIITNNYVINTSNLGRGIYVLLIENGSQSISKKLIIK